MNPQITQEAFDNQLHLHQTKWRTLGLPDKNKTTKHRLNLNKHDLRNLDLNGKDLSEAFL